MENLIYKYIIEKGKKADSTVGEPPYRQRGSTESQAQQKAAGAALSARRGKAPESSLKGASKQMVTMKLKDLEKLARLGDPVKGHKGVKEPKELKNLPGHVAPAKEETELDYNALMHVIQNPEEVEKEESVDLDETSKEQLPQETKEPKKISLSSVFEYNAIMDLVQPEINEPIISQQYGTKEDRILSAQQDWAKLGWRLRGFDEETIALKKLSWTYGITVEEILENNDTRSEYNNTSKQYSLLRFLK